MKKQSWYKKLYAFLLIAAMAIPNMPGTVQAEDNDKDTQLVTAGIDDVTSTKADFMTTEEYSALGFGNLKSADSYVEADFNPLEGYQPQILNELYIGYMNHPDDYNGYFSTAQEVSTISAANLNLNTMEDTNVGATQKYDVYGDDMETQCINAIGMIPGNINEDDAAVREQILIESRLYVDTTKRNSSHHRVQAYSLVDEKWTGGKAIVTNLASKDDWVADITIREQGGFNAMTTGDFDGDSYNEVAVFNPGSSNNGGCIYIYQPEKQSDGTYTLKSDGEYWIKDLGSRFNWGNGACRPLVSMTTTNMAGYDDIVVSVTLPYDNHAAACDAGVVGVITCNNGSYSKLWWDAMVIGNDEGRFKLQNVTNADLNGDGQDEIVIAGHKNTGYAKGSKRGSMDSDEMYVNVLLHDGQNYYLAWDDSETPTVLRHSELYIDTDGENDPITLTAGKYLSGQFNDTVFCEGVFLHFASDASQVDADKQIINGKFSCDSSENLKFSNTDEAFIGAVATGCFVEDQRTLEQTVIVQGHNALDDDTCDINITWFYGAADENGLESIKQVESNNDFINNANEDDNGTCVVLAAVNVDADSGYIKYKERYYGYSNPAILGVMLSAPYWEELGYDGGSTSFQISYSEGYSTTHEGSVGFDANVSFGVGAEGFGSEVSGGIDINFAANYIHSHTEGRTEKKYKTFVGAAGYDMVALTVVPIVSYYYDMIDPSTGETEPLVVNTTYTPAFACISVDKYNNVAKQFNEKQPEDAKLTVIDLDEMFYEGYTSGDVSSYPARVEDIEGLDKETMRQSDPIALDVNGKGSISVGFSEEETDTRSNGLSLSLGIGSTLNIQGGVGFAGVGTYGYVNLTGHITGSYGYTYASTTAEGYLYEGTLVNLPDSAQTGTDPYGNPTSSYGFTATMVSWEQRLNKLADSSSGEVVYESIPFIGYTTQTLMTPPRKVMDLRLSGITKGTAVLNWTKPTDRTDSAGNTVSVDHYKVYVSTSPDGEYRVVQSGGVDVEIDGSATSYVVTGLEPDTTYYFKIRSFNEQNDGSCLSDAAKGTTLAVGAPIINQHPRDLDIYLGHEFSFAVEAKPFHSDSTLSYQWQKLSDGNWVNIAGATTATYKVNESTQADENLKVQCVITETHTDGTKASITSQSATLTIVPNGEALRESSLALDMYFYPKGSGDDDFPDYVSGECYQVAGEPVEVQLLLRDERMPLNTNRTYTGKVYVYSLEEGKFIDGYPKDITYLCNGMAMYDFEISGLEKGDYYVVATFDGNENYTAVTSATAVIHITDAVEINYELDGGANHEKNPTWCNDNWTDPVRFYAPTKEGYTFLGWYLDAEYQKEIPYVSQHWAYELETKDINSDSITLYAKWELENINDPCRITYELNGGVNGNNPDTVPVDEKITLAAPTKEGYQFEGWYTDAALTKPCTIVSGTDGKEITVYAKWGQPTEYRINYVLGDGVNAESNPETYTIESEEIVFADPVCDEYEFGGWYTDAEYTTRVTSIPKGSTGDVTIYAKWKLIDALELNESGVYEISSYEDLIAMAQMIKEAPEIYAGADYIQTGNITCGMRPWPLAIGSESAPFTGTYEGYDYYILGLRPTDAVSGLFGVIGESGVVRNLAVVDFDYESEARLASGFVGINYGTIDGCGSGVNLTSAATIFRNGEAVPITTLDSEIKATQVAGGLAAINEGTIKNSRSSANVTIIGKEDETLAGGIAGENTGAITNVYQTGVVSDAAYTGGIAGVHSGSIRYGYNSTVVTSTVEGAYIGAVAGMNEEGSILDFFYISDMEAAAGNQADSAFTVTKKTTEEMKRAEFSEELNALVEGQGLGAWTQSDSKNEGYPRIESQVVIRRTMVSSSRNMSISGLIHPNAKVRLVKLNGTDAEFVTLQEGLATGKLAEGWRIALVYDDGTYATWEGELTIQIKPETVEKLKELALVYYDVNGEHKFPNVKIEGNTLTIKVAELGSLGVVAPVDESENEEDKSNEEGSDETTPDKTESEKDNIDSSKNPAATGDGSPMLLFLFLFMASISCIAIIVNKKKRGTENES